ncbi:hypothetical protein VKT23_003368 [Stygiomarasmius scandens]|uniref:Uncharacterized protein n=1 Tax=Marasmiellus scandens TaxID=2682957 RepID=A0ABR1JWZ1_9AGAR
MSTNVSKSASSTASSSSRSVSVAASSGISRQVQDPGAPTAGATSSETTPSTSAANGTSAKASNSPSAGASSASPKPSGNTTSAGRTSSASAGNGANQPVSSGSTDIQKAVNTDQTSDNRSTSVQVVTNHLAPSATTTITSQAESTFSSLVGVTTTNAVDGKASVVFPPLVTVLSTTENADGSMVTVTNIIANPTGSAAESHNVKDDSFLHNQGAVAGVFLVVGIAVASLIAGLILLCRRRRKRREQRQQWIASIRRRLPSIDAPFRDQEDMQQVEHFEPAATPSNPAPAYDYSPRTPVATADPFRDSFYGNSGYAPKDRVSTVSPFSDNYAYRAADIGIAVSTDVPTSRERALSPSHPSLVQSSPSIYPPTLPLSNDDVSSIYEEVELRQEPVQPPVTHAKQDSVLIPISPMTPAFVDGTGTVISPPRPPRSALREVPSKTMDYRPLTPPESSQGHLSEDASKPPSPIGSRFSAISDDYPTVERVYTPPATAKPVGIEDIVNRRTLLDIRPRPSMDNVRR